MSRPRPFARRLLRKNASTVRKEEKPRTIFALTLTPLMAQAIMRALGGHNAIFLSQVSRKPVGAWAKLPMRVVRALHLIANAIGDRPAPIILKRSQVDTLALLSDACREAACHYTHGATRCALYDRVVVIERLLNPSAIELIAALAP